MTEILELLKANPLLPAEDFEALRKKGIKHIEELGHDIWTEYNASDPGITMLDAVCYAITDLAYRTGFEVKDLIAPDNLNKNTWRQIFYTARQIMHNSALTINDYRKMIIDVDGVRNAWIQPAKDYEVPVWVDYNFSHLDRHQDCSCDDHPVKECKGRLSLDPATRGSVLHDKEEFSALLSERIEKLNKKIDKLSQKPNKQNKIDSLKKEIDELSKLKKETDKEIQTRKNVDQNIINSKIVEFEGLYNVMVEYEEDVLQNNRRDKVRQAVVNQLYRHRNLCEDFISIDAVEYEEFGLGASISLEEYADPDDVLAKIFFTIYKYFTPSVSFNTIDQIFEKGYTADEIFEGPALQHGFIDTVELERTDLFRDIRLSDIINDIADIKGIKAITYLHLPFEGFDKPYSGTNYFYKWLRFLKQERKIARIDPVRSQVIFCKEREFITYFTGSPDDRRPERMLKLFRDLKSLERKYKLDLDDDERDFPVPVGEYMDLEDYYPVMYSLPVCYGVSEREGLLDYTNEKRKVQVLQLKGYLLFFEQLMANYLVQLNHLKDLFTFDESVEHTYFTRAVTEINDLQSLVVDHGNHGSDEWDKILDDFSHVLMNIVETPTQFLKRRNRFLDHMLARFSEDLGEYETISRWLTPSGVNERMIRDKIAILKNGEYYKISTNRAKGFDYSERETWNTNNVSGAERRLSRLLGFANANRRTLTPDHILIERMPTNDDHDEGHTHPTNKNIIKFLDPENTQVVLMKSVEVKHGCCTESLLSEILEYADDRRYYVFKDGWNQGARRSQESAGPFSFELYDDTKGNNGVLLATSATFSNVNDRDNAFRKLQKLMSGINNNEGLHLVEHLLLRPKLDKVLDEHHHETEVLFPEICLDPCDLGIGLNQGTEVPPYRKKVHRIPADKCYDKMPWILEYFRLITATNSYDQSVLFQEVFTDGRQPTLLKFTRYEALTRRVRDLQQYGSERANYKIVSNDEIDQANLKYGFIIYGNNKTVLAQSLYLFNMKPKGSNAPIADDVETEIENLMRYFGFELDLYCEADPCDSNEDPYSFRVTVILPCWPKRLRNPTFRNLVEKTIDTEFPAHVHARVLWIGIAEMKKFEKVYRAWLDEMAATEIPQYEVVNRMVHFLDNIEPCGCCNDDCDEHGEGGSEHRRKHTKHV